MRPRPRSRICAEMEERARASLCGRSGMHHWTASVHARSTRWTASKWSSELCREGGVQGKTGRMHHIRTRADVYEAQQISCDKAGNHGQLHESTWKRTPMERLDYNKKGSPRMRTYEMHDTNRRQVVRAAGKRESGSDSEMGKKMAQAWETQVRRKAANKPK